MIVGRLLICVSMAVCCCSALAVQPDTVVVENSRLRLAFVTTPVPFLEELVHKPSGRNLIAKPASQALFILHLSQAQGGRASIESQRAKEGSIEITRIDGSQHIAIRFAGLGPAGDMRVRLEGRLDDAEPFVRWSIAVDNPSRQPLLRVRFPCISVVPAIGTPDDDFIVAPALPGAIIENPAKQWPANYSLGWSFPGDQSVQFLSYQDRTAGIYVASMDAVGYGRSLQIAKRANDYQVCQEYQLSDEPAVRWESPYEVALGVTSGSWQQTADIYKRWAVQQLWCAKTLVQRGDIPDWWKRGPCIHTVEVRTYDRDGICNGSYYPKLQEHLRKLREKIDGPVVPMLAGWENHRRWTAGDYFPAFDAANAKSVTAQLRRDGFFPFVFLSGLFYTSDNEGRDGSPVPGFDRYAASFAIDKETGKPKTAILNESNARSTWKRHSYWFCPAAPGTKPFFGSVIDRLHELGIDVVQMDQTTAGAGTACYSAAHGHPPGPGPYQAQAFHELLRDMRQHGRSLSRQFLLFHEEPHEELIPYLDGFHTRESRERWWYRRAPGARGIPLFTYLYHEYAIAYGGEGPSAGKAKNPAVVREHAVNLVTGKTPAVSVWSSQAVMADAHLDQIRMLRNHSRLLNTEAQRFLMVGRMLHPLEFDVPTTTVQLGVERDGKWRQEPFEDRAVLTSSWQSPEGQVGHCLVNITDERQPLRLQLDTRNAPSWPKADVDLYRGEKLNTSQPLFRDTTLPREYTLELEPLEAVFFVIRPE